MSSGLKWALASAVVLLSGGVMTLLLVAGAVVAAILPVSSPTPGGITDVPPVAQFRVVDQGLLAGAPPGGYPD